MKKIFFILCCVILFPINVLARRGCCSHHGGVAGCGANGRQICNDGTYSPSCTCEYYNPVVNEIIYGCTDSEANNYNANATDDDGTCTYDIYGCMDLTANNYNKFATIDDHSCQYDENIQNQTEDDYDELKENDNDNDTDESSAIIILVIVFIIYIGSCSLNIRKMK